LKTTTSSHRKNGVLALCIGMILHFSAITPSAAQCSNNLSVRQYDTLITGIGYGTYHLSFPQWRADSGTLVSVKINAVVSLSYGYTLRNADAIPSTYNVSVGRQDKFTSSALLAPFVSLTEQSIGSFPLNPGDQVVQAPFLFLDHTTNTDSIVGAITGFIGQGLVNFTYSPITYTDVQTGNNASYFFSAAAKDSVRVSLTYLYCTNILLANSLTRFDAVLQQPGLVRLTWNTENEAAGRAYELQESRDGTHFNALVSLPAVVQASGGADYAYNRVLSGATGGKWYYRLKINDGHGGIAWSSIRVLDLGGMGVGRPSLYPNPARGYVNILFGGTGAGNWQVDLLSAAGVLVQRGAYTHCQQARLDFEHPLASGTYFIRVTDGQGQKSDVFPLLISQEVH